MPWFRVDDGFAFHPKAMEAQNAAIGMWTRAGSWSAQHLTDGVIPLHLVKQLGPLSQAHRLVEAGLWIPDGPGFMFHEWEGRNPTRDEVQAKRAADAERVRRWRKGKGQTG